MTMPGGKTELLTTFCVGGEYFGIEVLKVQEVTGTPTVVSVPLAPGFVKGLINLRGQIATAMGLREIFGHESRGADCQMSVVCRLDGNLVSLIVDSIGDVIEVDTADFEKVQESAPAGHKKYIKGVYKLSERLLSVIDLEALAKELSPSADAA
jgi:purine-binding chemotaxis protein CheW